MNIPPLYPDENVMGWRGRIRFFNHHPTIKFTIAELRSFFDRQHFGNRRLTQETSPLFILAHFSKMTPHDFAYKHTFLPFIRPFSPDIFIHIDDRIRKQRNLRYGTQTGKDGSWFCASCVNEDFDIYGMPYWRRTHQLIGVDWCYKHRHKLRGEPSNEAFDMPPPISETKNKFLIPDGPISLDEAEPIIQRYAIIAKALLERTSILDLRKTAIMLKRQFLARTQFDDLNKSNINSEIEERIPKYWIRRFAKLRTKAPGNDILTFFKIFNHNQIPLDTERYVVALASLFDTTDAALRNLDQSNRIETSSEFLRNNDEREFWWCQDILHDYANNQGCHNSFSSQRGLNYQLTSNALTAHGLPNFGEVAEAPKKALQAFFEGESLINACQMYNLDTNDVENLLRIAGTRLAKGLQDMTTNK